MDDLFIQDRDSDGDIKAINLEIRNPTLIRDGCLNTTGASSSGLDFDLFDCFDLVGYDTYSTIVEDIGGCLDLCTAQKEPACYGFSYTHDSKVCYCKGSSIAGKSPSNNTNVLFGRANSTVLEISNWQSLCPYPNLSTQTAGNGMEFEIFCGADTSGSDYQPWISSLPNPRWDVYSKAIHTASFSDCIELCSGSHPLCQGVSFGGPDYGYLNCFLKSGTHKVTASNYVVHTAKLIGLPTISKPSCKKGSILQSMNFQNFTTFCNDFRGDNNITAIHQSTIEACINSCATYEPTQGPSCVGIMFDDGLQSGWENCYLKSNIGTGEEKSNYTLAVISTLASTVSPPLIPMKHSSRTRLTWEISGPIIFATAAIILYIIWRCLKRRPRRWPRWWHSRRQETSQALL